MNLALRAAVIATAMATTLPWSIAARAPIVRTAYLTATDRQGAPVLDLSASEIRVKEGGRDQPVVALDPATDRMHISLIVDDNGTGVFRSSVAQFINRLHNEAEFALVVVTGQPMTLQDYTSDVRRLSAALGLIGARPGTPDGGQLLSAIYEAARDLRRREATRPAIVAMTVGGDEHSPLPAREVLNRIRDSRATLNVFEMASTILRPVSPVSRASQLLEESLNINEVLGDGSRQSGGRKDEIVAFTGMVRGVQQLAEELSRQYKLSYTLPEGTRPSERLEVTVTRPDVVLRAPSRVPVQ